jgi:hypothetical protein
LHSPRRLSADTFHVSGLCSVPTSLRPYVPTVESFQGYSTSPSCPSWHQAFSRASPILSHPRNPFSIGVRSLHVLCRLFPRFLWVSSVERIYLSWSVCAPYPFVVRCQTCPLIPLDASASSSNYQKLTLFSGLCVSQSDHEVTPFARCLLSVATFSFVAKSRGRCLRFRTAIRSHCSWLRSILSMVDISGNYSSQSFRIGAVLSAVAGVPDHLITILGRWSSYTYQLYFRTPSHVLTSVAAVMA